MYNDYLMHHGILGQKWGVRRFQNADGSLTTAGKLRVAKGQVSEGKISKNEYKTVKKYAKAKIASDRAETHEARYHKNYAMGDAITSDNFRKKQARQEYNYNKRYQELEKSSKKVVDKFVKDMGKTSLSSLNTDTINVGRGIMNAQFLSTVLAGAPIGIATGIAGQAVATYSKRVRAMDEGKHVTQYDRYGRITKIK